MKVYKVIFENNKPISAIPADHLSHGEIGFGVNNSNVVKWLTIACDDPDIAIEVADHTVETVKNKIEAGLLS